MSWNVRRLAIAIENSALTLALAFLVAQGYWKLAIVAAVVKFIDNVLFAQDWIRHGEPRIAENN